MPEFIYKQCKASKSHCKIIIAQPRRIAALNLWNRLKSSLGEEAVGLKMGGGVKEGAVSSNITFVTTGYLVRLLVGNLNIASYTHIIIDEVHERSVDSDVCCYFVRELLASHPTLRVILMSATMQYQLYRDYFNCAGGDYGDLECMSVGVRRFPVDVHYAEDLVERCPKAAKQLSQMTSDEFTIREGSVFPTRILQFQYALVEHICSDNSNFGRGVLVFVSGMNDITELSEIFAKRNLNKDTLGMFKVYVIHSEIPLEEQEEAFLPVDPNFVKIVLGTNAAESSITIPDCDVVICLGAAKSVQYNKHTHRSMICNNWISKASANQRAGRTGRVRPGTVYRLYSQKRFDTFDEHNASEINRVPLQDIIIQLRSVIEQQLSNSQKKRSVVTILEDLIEPPSMENVEQSFELLFDAGMIEESSDTANLTQLGRFASNLSVGVQLSRLIGLGQSLGLGVEATIIASAMSQTKSLFCIASPLMEKDPNKLHDTSKRTLLGQQFLDAGILSEPIMLLRAFFAYEALTDVRRDSWLTNLGFAHVRFR